MNCKSDKSILYSLDDELDNIFNDYEVPNELEDVLSSVLDKIPDSKAEEFGFKEYKNIMKTAYKSRYNNPYNKFINNKKAKVIKMIKKPIKKYCTNKLKKNKFIKLLKVI